MKRVSCYSEEVKIELGKEDVHGTPKINGIS